MAEALREVIGDRIARGWTVIDGGAGATATKPVVVGALVRSPGLEAALRDALANDDRKQLRAEPRQNIDLPALRGLGLVADVVICDLDRAQPQALEAIAAFVADPKSPPLIVTAPALDVTAVCDLVHRGVHHILLQPLQRAEVEGVLKHALAGGAVKPATPARRTGVVVSLLGSCGGVGVTSLAVQGACALSRLKRYKRAADLCLLDLDVQFGSAALQLDARQPSSIIDLVREPERLDGAMLRGAMVRVADGRFDLLAAPPGFVAIDDIDPEAVAAAVETASREYALTIVDLPTLWSHWTHAALRASNVIALVAQPTVPSLRHGRRQIEMLRAEDLDDIPLVVVVNRVVSGLLGSAGVSMKGAETALGRKVDYTIPEAAAMRAAADAGVALGEVRGGPSLEGRIAEMFDGIITSCAAAAQLASADD